METQRAFPVWVPDMSCHVLTVGASRVVCGGGLLYVGPGRLVEISPHMNSAEYIQILEKRTCAQRS